MVEHDLPTVRSAVEAMIRAQADGLGDTTKNVNPREAQYASKY
jgi:hypothetical protein